VRVGPGVQLVKARKQALAVFVDRLEQLSGTLARLLTELAEGVTPPEQLPAFKKLLEDARDTVKVPCRGVCGVGVLFGPGVNAPWS
jgi:hypothetical protein